MARGDRKAAPKAAQQGIEWGVEQAAVGSFAERAYLNYSMYVILDRALPYLGDGLKPVQRRIIYAMSELGLAAAAKPKKSARTIGDVIGKYHPHGDGASYEAMVLMAQPFAFRYPLIEGQGNWGSVDDPKSFAAMRYTESRLTPYCGALLDELGQGTVAWRPNFDGTMQEPEILPAKLPNVLLNGASGIAVGMATDVPPHNAREVAAACVQLLRNSRVGVAELMESVRGPDYPGGGEIITPPDAIRRIYESGAGVIRMRATYETEGRSVVITSLPFQVAGGRVMAQLFAQAQGDMRALIKDLRDESDEAHPVRIVVVPRARSASAHELMSFLFAATDLERSYRVNLNVIGLDARPRVMNLKEMLQAWLEFRLTTVRRRLQWRLAKVEERAEILQGLLTVHLNVDEVVGIVRQEKEPAKVLERRFGLSANQARAILDVRLRQLNRMEKIEIERELGALDAERDQIRLRLSSPRRLKTLVRKELQQAAETWGDERRTRIVERAEARTFQPQKVVVSESQTVVLSRQGWVRVVKERDKGRDKGSDKNRDKERPADPRELEYRAGDGFLDAAAGESGDTVLFLDSAGRCYAVPAHTLPARGRSEPLSSRFHVGDAADFVCVVSGGETDRCLIASSFGYGFVTTLGQLAARNRAGKQVMNLPAGAVALGAFKMADPSSSHVLALTSEGYLLVVAAAEIPELAKGRGNKIIQIPRERLRERREHLAHAACMGEGAVVELHAGRRVKRLGFDDLQYYIGARGRRGRMLARPWRRPDRIRIVEKDR